jgi:hypothetical protein
MTWTTKMAWRDGQHHVTLLRGAAVVAEMTLDEWAELSATAFLVEDQVRQAVLNTAEPAHE